MVWDFLKFPFIKISGNVRSYVKTQFYLCDKPYRDNSLVVSVLGWNRYTGCLSTRVDTDVSLQR